MDPSWFTNLFIRIRPKKGYSNFAAEVPFAPRYNRRPWICRWCSSARRFMRVPPACAQSRLWIDGQVPPPRCPTLAESPRRDSSNNPPGSTLPISARQFRTEGNEPFTITPDESGKSPNDPALRAVFFTLIALPCLALCARQAQISLSIVADRRRLEIPREHNTLETLSALPARKAQK